MAVTTAREYGLFINGELVEQQAGEVRDLTEPATGDRLGRVALAGDADVDRAVEAARAAVDGPWGKTPPTERSRLLHALADAMVANRKELAELEARNVGKAISSVKAELNQGGEQERARRDGVEAVQPVRALRPPGSDPGRGLAPAFRVAMIPPCAFSSG